MIENEIIIRLICFLSSLIILVLWEYKAPKRKLTVSKKMRWTQNLSLVIINSLIVKLLIPFTAAGVAIYASQAQIGILNYLHLSIIVKIIIAILLLDLLIYAQHVAFHYIPIFWRLHKIHHIDQDIDVTTGVRFHPLEILLSALIKCLAVLIFGIPFVAIVIFEILLNITAMFNHSNIKLSFKLDKLLRLILVTPDMHRVHHSVIVKETNSNFGFNISWWDKIFRTYKAQPIEGHLRMQIGLTQYPDIKNTGLISLLMLPFKSKI